LDYDIQPQIEYEKAVGEVEKVWNMSAADFYHALGRREYYAEHDVLYTWIDEIKPTSVYQVGIGFGRELKPLFSKPYIKKIVGMDISEEMLKYLKEWLGNLSEDPRLELLHGNICDGTTFKDASFDLAFTLGCLTHVPRRCMPFALQELLRIAKRVINIELFWEHVPHQNFKLFIHGNPPGFSYDYPNLYSQLGAIIERTTRVAGEGAGEAYYIIQVRK